jgi:hypothetical protein
MYLCPAYYTLENIVHYENSNERYKFSIRAARNISKLRGQREIKPVSSNPGIRSIYVPVAYEYLRKYRTLRKFEFEKTHYYRELTKQTWPWRSDRLSIKSVAWPPSKYPIIWRDDRLSLSVIGFFDSCFALRFYLDTRSALHSPNFFKFFFILTYITKVRHTYTHITKAWKAFWTVWAGGRGILKRAAALSGRYPCIQTHATPIH